MGRALDVAVQGNFLYVANDEDGLRIYDVTDPGTPIDVCGKILDNCRVPGLCVNGITLAVAALKSGVLLFDVTDPAAPDHLCTIPGDLCGSAFDVAMAGTTLVIAGDRITTWNISNRAIPVKLATIECFEGCMAISDSKLYVACGNLGLWIYDISVPGVPVKLYGATTDIPEGYAADVWISGTRAYLAMREAGIVIYDISNPQAPVPICQIQTDDRSSPTEEQSWPVDCVNGIALGVAANLNMVYASVFGVGFCAYDITNLASPIKVKTIPSSEITGGMAIRGDHLWQANGDDGTKCFRIKHSSRILSFVQTGNPGMYVANHPPGEVPIVPVQSDVGTWPPYMVARTSAGGICEGLCLDGDTLWVANWHDGIRKYDITDKTTPVFLSKVAIPKSDYVQNTTRIHKAGFCVCAASRGRGLEIWDVRTTAPTYNGWLSLTVIGSIPTDLLIVGENLIVGTETKGLAIYSISDLFIIEVPQEGEAARQPHVLYSQGTGLVKGICASGNIVFVSKGDAGIEVLDITVPAVPVQLATIAILNVRHCCHRASDSTLFAACGPDGVRIYDVSTPATPVQTAHLTYPVSAALAVALLSNTMLLIANYQDLVLVDITDRTVPVILNRQYIGSKVIQVHAAGGYAYVAHESGFSIFGIESGLWLNKRIPASRSPGASLNI